MSIARIIVGSGNPAKLEAVSAAFMNFFPQMSFELQPVSAPSGVNAQPFSGVETLQGAENRVRAARDLEPNADFWIGIEGGLEPVPGEPERLLSFCWVVILGKHQSGRARSASYELPRVVSDLIHQGLELGDADDIVFGVSGSKRESGGVGLLTKEKIARSQFYAEAVKLALIPFVNPNLFPPGED